MSPVIDNWTWEDGNQKVHKKNEEAPVKGRALTEQATHQKNLFFYLSLTKSLICGP